jgi:hypothetical protein
MVLAGTALLADVVTLCLGTTAFPVYIVSVERISKIRNSNLKPLQMEVLRLERAVVLARKGKPAWGLRLNGPRERICFASSYFIRGFPRFLLFLDCDPQPKQLSDTISGNIYTKRHPCSIFPPSLLHALGLLYGSVVVWFCLVGTGGVDILQEQVAGTYCCVRALSLTRRSRKTCSRGLAWS